jgi:hypothetical protein
VVVFPGGGMVAMLGDFVGILEEELEGPDHVLF